MTITWIQTFWVCVTFTFSLPIFEASAVASLSPLPNRLAFQKQPHEKHLPSSFQLRKGQKQRQQQQKQPPQWLSQVLAGGFSRALAQAILYPVDALRTLAQTRDGRTLADVGLKALSRGCFTTSSFALAQGALQFGIFQALRPHLGPIGASALGAAGSCLVSVPQEVIKQRLVTGVYASFRSAVQTIYQTEGIRGFYSAWRPTVSRNVPFVIVCFTTMDVMKQYLLRRHQLLSSSSNDNNQLSALENLLLGTSSAFVAGLATQPIDVVKTRMMTQAASQQVPYASAWDCVCTIIRQEGWTKLYSGLKQRSIYMCGLWGIVFALNGYFTQKQQEPLYRQRQKSAAGMSSIKRKTMQSSK